MKEVHFTDGVLTWTEVHYRWQKDGKGGDSFDDCLDAWLNEPVEPAPRLARIEAFLNTIGAHKNQFVIFHTEGLREQIATIREKIDAPRDWVLKQVVEAEDRTLTLIHLLRESNKKSQIAKAPRPKVDELRERIRKIMRRERKSGHTLNEVLYTWRHDQIDGLRLTYEREKDTYFIDDENADMAEREFTYRQLRTIFNGAS